MGVPGDRSQSPSPVSPVSGVPGDRSQSPSPVNAGTSPVNAGTVKVARLLTQGLQNTTSAAKLTQDLQATATEGLAKSVSTLGLESKKAAHSKAYLKEEALPSANQNAAKKHLPLPEYRSDLGLFEALFTWHGTIFPLVARSTAFWALWASHGVFIALKKFDVFILPDNDDESADETAVVEWSVITVPASLMVFFLVRPTA